MPKRIYEMTEAELETFIQKVSQVVERLQQEQPDSAEYNLEAGVLRDAKQLLTEKRSRPAKH